MTLRPASILIAGLLLARLAAQAQSAEDFDTSKYLPRTLQAILDQHGNAFPTAAPTKPSPPEFLFSGDSFPSRTRLTYTGKSRPISGLRKTAINGYFKSQDRLSLADLYETELLFREGKREWWLPVQTQLIPAFREEVREGGTPYVLLAWLGGIREAGKIDWIFLVAEFEAE